jgi:hypothetical protein
VAYYRKPSPNTQSRWMNLKYAGTCKVCGSAVAAGDYAFYDAAARTITCDTMACCEADGLHTQEWSGSPVSGRYVTVRAARRIGSPYTPTPANQ